MQNARRAAQNVAGEPKVAEVGAEHPPVGEASDEKKIPDNTS